MMSQPHSLKQWVSGVMRQVKVLHSQRASHQNISRDHGLGDVDADPLQFLHLNRDVKEQIC